MEMFDWEEQDRVSFEDSDRFEEDSLCSWISEPESLCNNFRGWKKQQNIFGSRNSQGGQPASLVELAAQVVAVHIPFEVVERVYPPIPEQLQLRIAYWSFPDNEEDLRIYSCLATGSSDEFQKGELLFKIRAVKDQLQIGFHLSATVIGQSPGKGTFNVAVTFDRCHITSCTCTCSSPASWCCHVVAVCLNRIYQPGQVRLRAPVSETLSRLQREQLQKFAQYLISELPQQILPTAQRLLDELLSNQQLVINTVGGAPDPTAGGNVHDHTLWCLDEAVLHENIHKILMKLCVPSPMVFSDVNYLSANAPPAAAEWSNLLRPLRGREPEGIWNLLSIVREMFKRNDRNAISLLDILTEEILACEQILVWWLLTKVSLGTGTGRGSNAGNNHSSQHSCSGLCEELVVLWRLAALNPALSPRDRQILFNQLYDWHIKILDRIWWAKARPMGVKRTDMETFSGLRPALEACLLDWSDYPIDRITFDLEDGRRWYSPCLHSRTFDAWSSELSKSGRAIQRCTKMCCSSPPTAIVEEAGSSSNIVASPSNHNGSTGSNRSSVSSEGFCESTEGKPSKGNSEEMAWRLDHFEKLFAECTIHQEEKPDSSFNVDLKKMEDPFEILFARAEALHAHGHVEEACKLVVQLADHLLDNPPDLTLELNSPKPNRGKKDKKFNPQSHQISLLASATLAKAAFLCTVLSEDPDYTHLAFRVGLYGLEMARPPASTKPLEVKLANQEQDLVTLLKNLSLLEPELHILRSRAFQLKEGSHNKRGEALLPLMLANYIFEVLVLSSQSTPPDEQLGFEAALAALGLKVNVSESDHPLLCEGTRRQRGELAISMLVHYKDNQEKLYKVMDKLLDKEVHQMYKQTHQPALYYHDTTNEPAEHTSSETEIKYWVEEDPLNAPSTEDWETKLRCTTFKTNRKHTKGIGSVDSSAPETNSSDNSPSLARRWHEPSGHDSASSGDSSDSFASSSSDDKGPVQSRDFECYTVGIGIGIPVETRIPTGSKVYNSRYRGKKMYPSIPNQPSEASAHFMIELAKTVLTKAGGNSSTAVLFTQPPASQSHRGPHRALHMCAFQIGLYAIGLQNAVSPNWLSRTYSTNVSWLTGQAMEIGIAAINFLKDTWEGHLTPSEIASLADRASRGRDPSVVCAAADLALSCLPHAQALNPNLIQRALIQCKEQSPELLERACLAVESAAKGGGVCPEVLFAVGKKWYELYSEEVTPDHSPARDNSSQQQAPQQQQPLVMENVITTVQLTCPPVQYALAYPTYAPYLAYVPTAYSYPSLAYYPSSHIRHPIYPLSPRSSLPASLPHVNQHQMNYLMSAYRVGMLALDTMARKIHDDRPPAKYDRNPPYGEDLKWLLVVAKSLGPSYLQDFCICCVNSISSPFILNELVLETAHYLAGQPMRSHVLAPLIQKCQQMFVACAHFKMYHISPQEYDEFIGIIRMARGVFQMTPNGPVQFNEFLQGLRRAKSCKKELWQRISTNLTTSVN